MKFSFRLLLFLLCSICVIQLNAQTTFTLEDIWVKYTYYPGSMPPVVSNTKKESFLLWDYNQLIRVPYAKADVETIIETHQFPEIDIKSVISNSLETEFLLATKTKELWRYSESSVYYTYSLQTKELHPLVDTLSLVRNPSYSPNSQSIVYFKDNNLFLKKGKEAPLAITTNGEKNKIINGMPDWVYEEEFEMKQAYTWSPDSKNILYLSFDESNVPEYSFPVFDSIYPINITYKYPKAGYPNSKVTAYIYNIDSKKTVSVPLSNSYEYIAEIFWIDSSRIALSCLNRHQNNLQIVEYTIGEKQSKVIYAYKTDTYIDIPTFFIPIAKTNSFIIRDDRDGFMNLYEFGYNGSVKRQLTKNIGDVLQVYGYFPETQKIYFQATNAIPSDKYIFSVQADGSNLALFSDKAGTHDVTFNSDASSWIHEYSNSNFIMEYSIAGLDSSQLKKPMQNEWMQDLKSTFKFNMPYYFTIPTQGSEKLEAYMIVPPKFNKKKKYPVIVQVYGGPTMQKVTNEFTYESYWYQYLATQGYVVVAVDCRGTEGKGSAYKKQTYMKLGELESFDFNLTSQYLKQLPFIDTTHMTIQGWSYGGYLSLLTVAKYPNSYTSAIAIAPVVDWRFYDNIYTERYMRMPQENPKGYTNASVLTYVKDIKADLFIAHGTSDDNVHLQNSMEFIRGCIHYNIPYTSIIFPNDAHSLFQKNSRIVLYKGIMDFLLKEKSYK